MIRRSLEFVIMNNTCLCVTLVGRGSDGGPKQFNQKSGTFFSKYFLLKEKSTQIGKKKRRK
jgi:hypothetical protein